MIGSGKVNAESDVDAVIHANQIPAIKTVNRRGDLRMPTDADRVLFEPPTGYRQVR